MMAPNGDWRQAVAMPLTWSQNNASPSQSANENVITYGNVRATLKDDLCKVLVGAVAFEVTGGHVKMTAGGVTVEISGDGLTINGGRVEHDGKNIGSTHKHGDVESGNDLTGVPEA
jgi:phage baseplate assembly protein gpV